MRANNERPPLTLRINLLRGDREDYLRELEDLNIKAHVCGYASQALIVEEAVNVQALPGFTDGRVSVQDEGAQPHRRPFAGERARSDFGVDW